MFDYTQYFEFTIYLKIAVLMVLLTFFLAIVLYVGSKKISAHIFALSSVVQGLFILSHGLSHSHATTANLQHFFYNNNSYIGSIAMMLMAYFATSFPEDKPSKAVRNTIIAYAIIMFPLYYLLPDFMILMPEVQSYAPWWKHAYGKGGILFLIPFFVAWGVALYALHVKKSQHTKQTRTHIHYMFWAIFVGGIIPSVVSILLPHFGYNGFAWMTTVFNFIWISIVAYSIIHHNQMNTRVVITEFLVLAAILILFLSFLV